MIDAIRGQAAQPTNPNTTTAPAQPNPRPIPVTLHDDAPHVAAAKRDLAAFAPLYDHYLGPIYRFCLTRLGDIDAAEDATALIFTKALHAIHTCQNDHFRPWLFTIARNVVTDTHRAARPHDSLAAANNIPDPSPSPADLALRADDIQSVHTLLTHLTPEQREIVELRLAGLTGPEIARALGRSHASIRVAQFRAYARLRILLAPDQPTPTHPDLQTGQPPSPAQEPPR